MTWVNNKLGWLENKSEAFVRYAEREIGKRTEREKLVNAVVGAGKLVAERRSYGDVRDRKLVSSPGADGQSATTIEVEVRRRRASKYMGYAAAALSFGTVAPFYTCFAFTAVATVIFAGVAATADARGDQGVAEAAWRLTTISALMTVPWIEKGFTPLYLATEFVALRAKRRARRFHLVGLRNTAAQ